MTLTILVVEDDREFLLAFAADLLGLSDSFRLEFVMSVPDAWDRIESIRNDDDDLALVLCEGWVSGDSGVEFLVALAADDRLDQAKKIIVTGSTRLNDTIRAVNNAHIDHCVATPWNGDDLRDVVSELLTDYVLDNDVDPLPYMRHLNDERVMEIWR